MAEVKKLTIWKARAVYLFICFLIIFIHSIPLDLSPKSFIMPDVMLIITIAVVIRKAAYIPYWLVGSAFLIADIMLNRPLGLWAFVTVATVEVVRANRFMFRDMFFVTEWLMVTITIVFMFLLQQFLLAFSLAPTLPMDSLIWKMTASALSYPIVVFVITKLFGIRKPSPAEFNMLGNRL